MVYEWEIDSDDEDDSSNNNFTAGVHLLVFLVDATKDMKNSKIKYNDGEVSTALQVSPSF